MAVVSNGLSFALVARSNMVNKQHAALLTAFNLLSRLVPLGCGYALNLMSPGPSIIPMRPRLVRACKREFDAAAPRAQCPTHRLLRASTAHSSHSTKRPKRELLRFGHFKSRTFDAHSRRSNNYLKQSVEANGLTPEERIEARRLYDVIHGTWHLLACMTVTGLAVGLIEAYSFDLDTWSEESYVRFKPRVGGPSLHARPLLLSVPRLATQSPSSPLSVCA